MYQLSFKVGSRSVNKILAGKLNLHWFLPIAIYSKSGVIWIKLEK